jgi:hypothetical protein
MFACKKDQKVAAAILKMHALLQCGDRCQNRVRSNLNFKKNIHLHRRMGIYNCGQNTLNSPPSLKTGAGEGYDIPIKLNPVTWV